jgi:S-adenosylmethionine decarboxylase
MFTTGAKTANSQYLADGRHLVANYKLCDLARLSDNKALIDVMRQAIAEASATILQTNIHEFDNGGMTAVFLLSESHASIHTYPEHGGCFVDLFTCGKACDDTVFDAVLRAYLMPQSVDCHSLSRTLT